MSRDTCVVQVFLLDELSGVVGVVNYGGNILCP